MSLRQTLTIIVCVILSLALAGPTWADGNGQVDPQATADALVGEAEGLKDHAQGEVESLAGDLVRVKQETTESTKDTVREARCEHGTLPEERDACEEDDKEGSSSSGPSANDTDPGKELEDLIGNLTGLTGDNTPSPGDATGHADDQASGIMDAIWKPLQEAGKEASRAFHDAYQAAANGAHFLYQEAARSLAHAVALGAYLADQASTLAWQQVGTLTGTAGGLLDDLLGVGGEEDGASGLQQEQGMRSTSVETPETSTLGMGMIIASGVGLALAGLAALRRLLGLGGLTLLSRIPSDQIMKNGTRNAIFEIVRLDPGVSLNEIVERVGLSRNAVAYHLAVFESEKVMTSVKDGKYRRYFLNGGRYVNGAKDVVAAIKNDKTLDVIRYIAEHPGVIQKDVCSAVGTSPSATSWHIRRLERVGLVEKERVANKVEYRPGPNLQKYDLSEFGLGGAEALPMCKQQPVAQTA